ncbi:cyclophilin-like fold protein [Merdimmobilis hominis]|nr:cyclophilin-like fold protein [Merdimmobilis hominis]
MRNRKQWILLAGLLIVLLMFTCCGQNNKTPGDGSEQSSVLAVSSDPSENNEESSSSQSESAAEREDTALKINVQVGDHLFTATLEDNTAADAFFEMMKTAPVLIEMRDYSGFEKVGSLGARLPASDHQTTTHEGDIVLYNGNQIVVFYGSNSWRYTRLGKIDDLSGFKDALGSGDVTVTFSAA